MNDSHTDSPGTANKSTGSAALSFVGKVLMLVLGAILAGFGGYLWTEYIKPKPIYVNIQVFDDSTPPNSLKNVAVWLGIQDVSPKQTGDFGVVRFEIPRKHRKEQVTPQLQLDGYASIEARNANKMTLDRNEMTAIFVLKKIVPPQPKFERRIYSSGSKPSGPGAAFSDWYELCSDPEPDGWTIDDSQTKFVLTGDRQCNAWSECKESVKDPRKVCWQFRMQGHSEQTGGLFNQGNTGIQFSTGVLSVLWKHQ